MSKSVLFLTREIVPFYFGGIGSQFKAMARLLVEAGYDVSFLTQKHENFDQEVFQVNYPGCEIYTVDRLSNEAVVNYSYSGGLVSHGQLSYALALSRAFAKIYQNKSPSFVVAADYGAESFITLLERQSGAYEDCEFILFIEGSTHDVLKTYESGISETVASELDDPQNKLTCSMEDICVRLSDVIVAPTQKAWTATKKRLVLNRSAEIIPNLVGDDFLAAQVNQSGRQQSKTILFVGRLDRHKGADLLLEAYIEKFKNPGEEANAPRIKFVGRDSFCKSYGMTFLSYWRERIPLHLMDHIEFTGQIDPEAVRHHLTEATVCVFPSRWEVFGIVCLEAMANACPVIVSAETGLAEVTGGEFSDYQLDFQDNSQGVFDIYRNLVEMGGDSYEGCCFAFHNRAIELVELGNNSIRKLFSRNDKLASIQVSDDNKMVSTNLIACLSAMNSIASALAFDFNKVSESYNVSDEEKKQLLRGSGSSASYGECNSQNLFAHIKNAIARHTT